MQDLHIEFDSSDAASIPPGLFFALPSRLLSALEKKLGAERFDADRWQEEKRLAKKCAVGDVVGFWRGQLISSDLIRPERPPVTPDLGAWLGLAEEEIEWVNSQGAGRVEWLEHISRAYAG